jgi:hypothetical protein
MEKPNDNQLILTQDYYQSLREFNVEVDIAEQIIIYFPTLSADTVRVLAKTIMNKLTQGVKYSEEMEKMIEMVFPKVVDGLRQTSEKRKSVQHKLDRVKPRSRSPSPERYRNK